MKNSLFLLQLENIDPQQLTYLPALAAYIKRGADLHLSPAPLIEQGQSYYQFMTGLESGKLGRFDAVYPQDYSALPAAASPEGAYRNLLPDLFQARKLSFLSVNVNDASDLTALAEPMDAVLVRIQAAGALPMDQLNSLVEQSLENTTPLTTVMVFTGVWNPPCSTHLNVNDFLADIGLLEVGDSRTRDTIVWSETLAYGLGTGQIWINMRGREPQGIVNAGREYQEVCDALIHELQTNWLHPQTGEPVVAQVFRREEIYHGDYLFKSPDLITVYRPGCEASPKAFSLDFDGASIQVHSQIDSVQPPFARLIASGPALLEGVSQKAALIDVLPTILYLTGQSIPQTIDGKVLLDICTAAFRGQKPVTYTDGDADELSDEEEGMIVDRLRDLGYLG